MSQAGTRTYRIREFAKLAGVTVRALQHYDRMGVLTPARSSRGSRVYSHADLQTLVEIVALKSMGVPLKKIGKLRANGPAALVETLGSQRRALERKQPVLDRVIFTVRNIEAAIGRGEETDPAVLKPLMDALRKGNGHSQQPPPAAPERRIPPWADLEQEWEALLADVEAASAEAETNPATMRALAARWERLMSLSTDGAPYARDLVPYLAILRSSSTPRLVPGGAPFEKIGPALADWIAPAGTARPGNR